MLWKRWFGPSSSREMAQLRRLKQKKKLAEGSYDLTLEQIRRLEAELRQKRSEFAHAKSNSQRQIMDGRINALADELQLIIERNRMTDRYVADIREAIHKLETIVAAKEQNLDEAYVDRLAVELEEAIGGLQDTDEAMRELRGQSYSPKVRSDSVASAGLLPDVPESPAPGINAAVAAAPNVLPVRTRERLKALGIEAE